MRWPIPPSFKDTERIWAYLAHLASNGFLSKAIEESFKSLRSTYRNFDKHFLTWPKTREERRKRVSEFTDHFVVSVLNMQQSPKGDLVDLRHMFQDQYLRAVGEAAQARFRDASDAERIIVSEDFAFPVFMNKFVEFVAVESIEQFRMLKWNEFYDAWDNRADAQIALTDEHRRRLSLDRDAYLPIHQIQELVTQHVQSLEQSLRTQGGSNKPLFPWPVR